jgi:hypothetical protein
MMKCKKGYKKIKPETSTKRWLKRYFERRTCRKIKREIGEMIMLIDKKTKITVCDKCFMASCWHGEFMCDDARYAGTVEKTVAELRKLDLEHPDHWLKQVDTCRK